MDKKRNHVRYVNPLTGTGGHFWAYEFEVGGDYEDAGYVVVHPSLIESLENVRAFLGKSMLQEVMIEITDGCRTRRKNDELGRRLGWTDDGGLVSRHSRHLVEHGGIACDFVAKVKATGNHVQRHLVATAARKFFDFVKADYPDGHIHADNRSRGAMDEG